AATGPAAVPSSAALTTARAGARPPGTSTFPRPRTPEEETVPSEPGTRPEGLAFVRALTEIASPCRAGTDGHGRGTTRHERANFPCLDRGGAGRGRGGAGRAVGAGGGHGRPAGPPPSCPGRAAETSRANPDGRRADHPGFRREGRASGRCGPGHRFG